MESSKLASSNHENIIKIPENQDENSESQMTKMESLQFHSLEILGDCGSEVRRCGR